MYSFVPTSHNVFLTRRHAPQLLPACPEIVRSANHSSTASVAALQRNSSPASIQAAPGCSSSILTCSLNALLQREELLQGC
jgi:hypothetical protein